MTRRGFFNIAWLASALLMLAHPNHFTRSLNNAFFTVGVGWMLLDILYWNAIYELRAKRKLEKALREQRKKKK